MRNRAQQLVVLLIALLSISVAINLSAETNGKKHKKEQTRPVKLGSSGGNNKDSTSSFCCSGTLGALVEDISGTTIKQYVLSNNHVLGLANKGRAGDDVDQPGLIDSNCSGSLQGPVADLSRKVNFKFGAAKKNLVDAAIAQVRPGAVDPSGAILDVGIPGQPIEAAIGDLVSKAGRTTGKTNGEIVALDTTILVPIPTSCGGSTTKQARFEDQFIILPLTARPFVLGGDSGSLIVEKKKGCPAAVGLLAFGDDAGVGGANRIQNVLTKLKVKIVGCPLSVAASPVQTRAFSMQDPRMVAAKSVKDRYIDHLIKTPGISAVGIGVVNKTSQQLGLIIYVTKGSVAAKAGAIPLRIENLPVKIFETSGFKLM